MIDVQNLTFAYRRGRPVLRDISFQAEGGEVLGVLGPAGAGKSTLQAVLAGLAPRYQGQASVLGAPCRRLPRRLYGRLGVEPEAAAFYEGLTVRQNLRLFERLYARPCYELGQLLARLGLEAAADRPVRACTGSERSRLRFARAVLPNPELLLLDEPTAGLDPDAAAAVKDVIKALAQQGKAVLLTTANARDAAELCTRVALLADGELKAVDTPRRLILRKGAQSVTYTYLDQNAERTVTVPKLRTGRDTLLLALVQNGALQTIHSDEPTLAEAYAELTGRRLD